MKLETVAGSPSSIGFWVACCLGCTSTLAVQVQVKAVPGSSVYKLPQLQHAAHSRFRSNVGNHAQHAVASQSLWGSNATWAEVGSSDSASNPWMLTDKGMHTLQPAPPAWNAPATTAPLPRACEDVQPPSLCASCHKITLNPE